MPTLAQSINISKVASFQVIVDQNLSKIVPIEQKQFFGWGGSVQNWLAWLKRIAEENIKIDSSGVATTLTPKDAALRVDTSLRVKAGAINELTGLTFSWNPTTKMWQDTPFLQSFALPVAFDLSGIPITADPVAPPAIPIASLGLSPSPETIAAVQAGLAGPAPPAPPAPPQIPVLEDIFLPLPAAPPKVVESDNPLFETTPVLTVQGPANLSEIIPVGDEMAAANIDTEFTSTFSTTTSGGGLLGSLPGIALGFLGDLFGGGPPRPDVTALPFPTALPDVAGFDFFQGTGTGGGFVPSGVQGDILGNLDPKTADLIRKVLEVFTPGGLITIELLLAAESLLNSFGIDLGKLGIPGLTPGTTSPAPPTFIPGGLIGPVQFPGTVSVPVAAGTANCPLPIAPVLATTSSVVRRAPPGYVVVDVPCNDGTVNTVAMWKPLARSMKLWKARAKPPIKASEWRALKTAERVKGKVKRISKLAGFTCSTKGSSRRRTATCK